jgi:hypothetical protein
MQPWTASPDRTKPVIVTLADGINQSVESIEIKDSQCTSVLNMDSFIYPTLQVRDGCTLFSQHTGYINKIFKFSGVWYCGNGKGMYKQSGSAWVAVYEYGEIYNNRLWDAAMFFDGSQLYFLNRLLQLSKYDGTTLTTLSSAPSSSSFLTTHANRFYLAGTNDNLLSYSGLRLADDWTSTNKYTGTGKITIETADGERPTGLVSFANHVILFKKYTMHELFGEDSTNFEMQNPYNVGCISDRSIVQTNEGLLFFLASDGFYVYMGGATPTKVSDPVRNYISKINLEYAQHCVSGTDGRFIYLSLVTGSETIPNVTLKYDLQRQSWWVESYVATSFYLDGQTLYYGTAEGRIMKVGGANDAGVLISWSIETKPFSEDDETVRKAIHKIYIVADIEIGSTLNISYAGGAEGGTQTSTWNQVYTTSNGTGKIQSIKIPIIVRTPETWYRLKINGTGKVKIHRIIRELSRRGS